MNNRELEEKIKKISVLQALQHARHQDGRGNQFPDDVQVAYYKTQHEIGVLAMQIYKQIKNDRERSDDAASYLSLALDCFPANSGVNIVLGAAIENHNIHFSAAESVENIFSTTTAAYHTGLNFLLGIGRSPINKLKAFACIKYAAEKKHAAAQTLLACFYLATAYDKKHYHAEAIKLLKLAAQQGNIAAQAKLGRMNSKGQFMPCNQAEAMKWFQSAALQGSVYAQRKLAKLCQTEKLNDVFRWTKLAAEQGSRKAQYALGIMFQKGKGVTENSHYAVKWLRLAADAGLDEADKILQEEFNSKYHVPMRRNDEEKVIHYLKDLRIISGAFLFDIHRSITNDALFSMVSSIAKALKSEGVNTTYYDLAIDIVAAKRQSMVFQCKVSKELFTVDKTNAAGVHAFMYAAEVGMTDFIRVLLEHGTNPNIRDERDWVALKFASYSGHQDIVELLLTFGADPNLSDETEKWTALHNAVHHGRSESVELLLKSGALPDAASTQLCTPLHLAAVRGYTSIVKILLAHGADPTLKNKDGMTPLLLAAQSKNIPCFLLLLGTGKCELPKSFDDFKNESLKLEIIDYIKTLPVNERITLCDKALDASTQLGNVFKMSTGIFNRDYSLNDLKKMKEEASRDENYLAAEKLIFEYAFKEEDVVKVDVAEVMIASVEMPVTVQPVIAPSAPPIKEPDDVFDQLFKYKKANHQQTNTPPVFHADCSAFLFSSKNLQPVSKEYQDQLNHFHKLMASSPKTNDNQSEADRTEAQLKLLEDLPVPTRSPDRASPIRVKLN